jgi:hypothetical protein
MLQDVGVQSFCCFRCKESSYQFLVSFFFLIGFVEEHNSHLSLSPSSTPAPLFHPFYRTLGNAFRNLSQLHDLELLFHDAALPPVLATCTFPRLRRFESFLSHSTVLASFLTRHPDLIYLQLSPTDRFNWVEPADQLPSVLLPKLEYLIGSSDCVPALAQGSSLRAACIEWTLVDQAVHECIAALETSSSESLRVLSCRRAGWNLDLIDAISSRLPDILVLSITNVLLVDVLPNDVRF